MDSLLRLIPAALSLSISLSIASLSSTFFNIRSLAFPASFRPPNSASLTPSLLFFSSCPSLAPALHPSLPPVSLHTPLCSFLTSFTLQLLHLSSSLQKEREWHRSPSDRMNETIQPYTPLVSPPLPCLTLQLA
ncbi:unnamed protein product [Pleuronectes platessa]|uniref:Uncharacterized protein n=1 Tax=Pleuronectes platessa TaxID=8262 RepID=A0A9N7TQ53_PLEPL|nr:unnamed protein product [Pleuronectes platessa]